MSEFDLSWLDQHLEGGAGEAIVFDIGAFDGSDSLRLRNHWMVGSVFSFEASPRNFGYLRANTAASDICAYNLALSDRDGELDFFDNQEGYGSGSILRPTAAMDEKCPHIIFNASIRVRSTTIESFCDAHHVSPDVLHIDVQGAEIYVISALGRHRPKLIFCETCEYPFYEGAKTLEALDAKMSEMGYKVHRRLTYDTLYLLCDSASVHAGRGTSGERAGTLGRLGPREVGRGAGSKSGEAP